MSKGKPRQKTVKYRCCPGKVLLMAATQCATDLQTLVLVRIYSFQEENRYEEYTNISVLLFIICLVPSYDTCNKGIQLTCIDSDNMLRNGNPLLLPDSGSKLSRHI